MELGSTVHHVASRPQSPSRRLRRCRCGCCYIDQSKARWGPRFSHYTYQVASGCVIHGDFPTYQAAHAALRGRGATLFGPMEIRRVWHYTDGCTYYEMIRGGRWVNAWHAQYGAHQDESKEKLRCTS